MEPENRVNICEKPPIEVEVKTSNGRRKLIRGALAGAPILLALKSSPVLACNCKLPSGFSASGNLSRNNGFACTQPAHSPSYWPNHIDTNNCFSGTGGVSKTTKFKNVFGGNDTRTLLEVLNSGTNFPSLVVSAYLGIKASYFVSGISIQNIKDMWNGLYRPTGSGNYWSPTENENYLRYTMGLPTV